MKTWLRQSRDEIDGYLRACDIDPKRRGETLTIDEFVNLSRALNDSRLLPPKVDG
jgi:16S rRNA A1518/A1519 N6-dimethyltransferase RsmA/KsgA/DIM1 with predicted DNA glycosylase/AP lyase activity